MKASVGNIIERLDLHPKEISYLKSYEKDKLLTLNSKRCTNSESEKNLRLKLRVEARRRMLKKKLELIPTDEEIEFFCAKLRDGAITLEEEDGTFIDYNSYKVALNAVPETLRNFLTTKSFMDVLQNCKTKNNGAVLIDSVSDYLLIKKSKLSKMINLHYYDTAGKGYLSVEDLRDYLENEVLPQIPSLNNLNNDDSMLHEYYMCVATRKFFFLLDTMRQMKIRIIDIVASRLLEEFDVLNETENSENGGGSEEPTTLRSSESLNWFSKENCLRIRDLYRQLDTDDNGLLSLSEMTGFQRVTTSFVKRVFEVNQTYDNDELDLAGFCDLILAMENKSDRSALTYYFRILDVDGDNMLTAPDLYFFYRDLAEMLEACFSEDSSQKAPPFEDIKNEVFDMCHSDTSRGITLKDLISSGKGGTVVGMLTDLDSFLEYENREDSLYEEEQ